ncbi:hypothetical protein M758_10G017000 [Ceratodon purpureus]|nr:hypothetical protein M758_10G017000 [Ceratodon purpureus]
MEALKGSHQDQGNHNQEEEELQVSEMTSVEEMEEMVSTSGEETEETSAMSVTSTVDVMTPATLRRRTSAHFKSVDSRDLLRDDVVPGEEAKKVVTTTRVEVTRNRTLRASSPAHRRNKESPLSSDAIWRQSHAGLFNLCIVVLIAVNSRLIIENLMKYGLLINSGFWFSSKSARDWPLLMCCLSLPIFPLSALLVEKLKSQTNVSEGVIFVLHLIISTTGIVYPAYVIHRVQSALLPGLVLILIALTGWMKLLSYAHANKDVREILKDGEKPDIPQHAENVEYPDNLTIKNIAYFMLAPTLCYQLSYPRSETVRKGWVLRQAGKLVVFLGLIGFIIEQYINPTVSKSQHPLKGNYLYAAERILKLSMPVLYVWLCMFYCLFHLWLNIVAELLRFGDREFYKDWWNAKTVEEYWRMWNMPVHKWMVRHIYFPSIRAGLPKAAAVFLVFVISALFHEVAIGVPCHMLRCWAFLGIMMQVPLVYLTNLIQDRWNNSMVRACHPETFDKENFNTS